MIFSLSITSNADVIAMLGYLARSCHLWRRLLPSTYCLPLPAVPVHTDVCFNVVRIYNFVLFGADHTNDADLHCEFDFDKLCVVNVSSAFFDIEVVSD